VNRRDPNLLLDAAARAAAATAVQATATLRFGVVTAVDTETGTVTVLLAGVEVPGIPCMGSYDDAAVDDVAWLLHQTSTLIAIGRA
jgi:hypothetical protein